MSEEPTMLIDVWVRCPYYACKADDRSTTNDMLTWDCWEMGQPSKIERGKHWKLESMPAAEVWQRMMKDAAR